MNDEFKLKISNFDVRWLDGTKMLLPKYDKPSVPVLIRNFGEFLIMLGTHNYCDRKKPKIEIQRRRDCWMIFLHSKGGKKPTAVVLFLDDGRCFLINATEIDKIKSMDVSCDPTMIIRRGSDMEL